MPYLATITSKKQFTIPAQVFRQLNFQEGQKVLVSEENGSMVVEPTLALIERLSGSVKIPARFKGLSLDKIIEKAKKEHFGK